MRPFRRASRTSKILIWIGVVIVLFFVLMALFGTDLWRYGPTQYRVEVAPGEFQSIPELQRPSWQHPFGTDRNNFDILARIIGGAQLAIIVVLVAVSLAMLIGVPLGLFSGYRGGWPDRLLTTSMDAVYAFPPLLLAIIIAFVLQGLFGGGIAAAAGAVGITYIPQYFRVVRNHTLSVKQEPFVEAARSLGAKDRTILGRYVFFNVVQSVPVILTLNAADSILTLAALGFLGYGIEPPTAEWGFDVSQAVSDVAAGIWWTAFWPGIAIVVLVTGLTLVGEGLNDVINPLLRARGAGGDEIPSEAEVEEHEPTALIEPEPGTEPAEEGAANR
ncbi:MAG: ABC transporter permease [Actinobacteria bacterium]|nr:ABC transporter permease [Actinomycetota bacterium]